VLGFTADDKPATAYGVSLHNYDRPEEGDIISGMPKGLVLRDNGDLTGTLNEEFENGEQNKVFSFYIGATSTYPEIQTNPEDDLHITFTVDNEKVERIKVSCDSEIG
jgi:hypothetical protein